MPVYEYACKDCGQHLEVAQSFKDEPLTTCELCGGPLRKVFGSIGVVLKGSGFYRTDSRNESRARSEKADKAKTDKAKAEKAGAKSSDGDSRSTKSDAAAGKSDASGKSDTTADSKSGSKSESKTRPADSAKSA